MRGFTLVEMLVVLVIASLLLLLVPPLFSKSVIRVGMNSQVNQVITSLKRARSQAVAQLKPVPWIMDLEEKSYQVGEAGRQKFIDDEFELSLTTAESEVIESGKKAAIRFYSDGGATGGTLQLSRENFEKVIAVDWLTGRVSVH